MRAESCNYFDHETSAPLSPPSTTPYVDQKLFISGILLKTAFNLLLQTQHITFAFRGDHLVEGQATHNFTVIWRIWAASMFSKTHIFYPSIYEFFFQLKRFLILSNDHSVALISFLLFSTYWWNVDIFVTYLSQKNYLILLDCLEDE